MEITYLLVPTITARPTYIQSIQPWGGEDSLSALYQALCSVQKCQYGIQALLYAFDRCTPPFLASALQLPTRLLQMPPASPFTASPFDLVINPGQRANSPVRPWLHPTFGRARLRLARTRQHVLALADEEEPRKWNKWRGDPSLWKPLEARPTRPGAQGACLGLRWPSPAI